MNTLKEDLQSVRDFVADHEWGQGFRANRGSDTFCLVEAVDVVIPRAEYMRQDQAFDAIEVAICNGRTFDPTVSMVAWNDRTDRTKDDVLALLDKAIESA